VGKMISISSKYILGEDEEINQGLTVFDKVSRNFSDDLNASVI
jgi:hypothetical protein